jgi:hypothetical protein
MVSSSYSERCEILESHANGTESKGQAKRYDKSLEFKHRQSNHIGNGLERKSLRRMWFLDGWSR